MNYCPLMDQSDFLNALTYIITNCIETFKILQDINIENVKQQYILRMVVVL